MTWLMPLPASPTRPGCRTTIRSGAAAPRDEHPPPTPGWKLAGFGSKEEAEAYKARARAQYGRSVSFPWDGYSG